jgi:aminoglycoside phosphotransferase (APT) family kinase protein
VAAEVLDPKEFEGVGVPAAVLKALQTTQPTDGQVVLLHGDYRPKNILIHDGQVVGLVDWGLAMPGDAHYDLAMLLWYLKDEALRTLFLNEYGQGKPILSHRLDYYERLAKFLNV